MAYATMNTQFKSHLKKAIADGAKVGIFQPGPFGRDTLPDGEHAIEGPHYPQPHRWYAIAILKDGIIQSIR